MGRIYTKRLSVLFLIVIAVYIAARNLKFNEKRSSTSWFFEYNTGQSSVPSSSSFLRSSSSSEDGDFASSNIGASFRRDIPLDDEVIVHPTETEIGSSTRKDGSVPSDSFLQLHKCPLCFGKEMCPQIRSGTVRLDLSQMIIATGKPRKISYEGIWQKSHQIVAKSLMPSEFGLLDQHVCVGVKEKSNCDVSAASLNTIRSSETGDIISIERIRELHKIMKKSRSDIPIAICANEKLIAQLKKAYDDDRDGKTSENELLMLYTSLASNPEIAILKLLTKSLPSLPFPQYYGACGRFFLIEGGITPLDDFISEPFHIRASLGAQLLQMVEEFMADDDSEWFVMFTEFAYENLGVNKDGEVVILDVEDMVLVDKTFLRNEEDSLESLQRNRSHEPCNKQCLQLFTQQVMHSSDSSKSCSSVQRYGHLMYAAVCQRILSYLDEHRVEDFFSVDSERKSVRKSPYQGLLHHPPNKDKASIEELLQECVIETAAGGRVQAAEELRDYLAEFFQDEDNGEENEDEENEANEYDINDNSQKQQQ